MSVAVVVILLLVALLAGLAALRGGRRLPSRTRALLWVMTAIAALVAVVQLVEGRHP